MDAAAWASAAREAVNFDFVTLFGLPGFEEALPHEIPLFALVGITLVAILVRFMREAGFTNSEALLLVLAAPLVTAADIAVGERNASTLAFNLAGFFIPVAVCVKILFEGRVKLLPVLIVVLVATAASFAYSHAVPERGILIFYRMPALLTAIAAVALSRLREDEAARLAFIGGAVGVIVGADALRIDALFEMTGPRHRIIVGGAGIFDGIFIVALLAMALALVLTAFVRMMREEYEKHRRAKPTPRVGEPVSEAGSPGH